MTPPPVPEHDADPLIVELVHDVGNRFGAQGLIELIAVAQVELKVAQTAMQSLGPNDNAPEPGAAHASS